MRKILTWTSVVAAALLLPSAIPYLSSQARNQDMQIESSPREAPSVPEYHSPNGRHKIQLQDPELASRIKAEGGRVIADYGDYQLLDVNDETADALSKKKQGELHDEYNVVLLNAGPIDTTDQEFEKKTLQLQAFSGARLHLVQFAGPIKPEWYQELVETGVEVVTYIPNNAYLVYGDSRSLRRIRGLASQRSHIQWEGDYKDEYKMDPNVNRRDKEGNAIQLQADFEDVYAIQTLAGKPSGTEQLISQLSSEVLVQWNILNYHNFVVRISQANLKLVGQQDDIVSIALYPIPTKFDERQDQIIAGNLTSGVPTAADYLAYLAGIGFTQSQFTTSGFAVNLSDSGVDNATTTPNHFGLYVGGLTSNPSRVIYNRLEGTPHVGSTLQGCDGHGNLNAHIIAGFIPFGFGSGFPHTDTAGFRYGLGVAPFVKVGSSVIFDPDIFTNPNIVNLESKAYNDGARISSNSWGANTAGAYNVNSQTYDAVVRDAQPTGSTFPAAGNQEYTIVFAAGNAGAGAQTVGAPGTAKNVITAGASENVHSHSTANGGNNAAGNDGCGVPDTGADSANDIINFSSRGPCSDQRKKPDLVAPGTHVTGGVAQAPSPGTNGTANACFTSGGVCALPGSGTIGDPDNFFPAGQQFYTTSSGTSHSTPAISGAAALVRQHFINQSLTPPSPALTKATLMNSARYLNGVGANDNLWSNSQGMGEVNLNSFFDIFATPHVFKDEVPADTFTATGQTRVVAGTVPDITKPFRVTLVWTDAPGPTTGNAFVNNLDLEVTVGGNTYKGNVFSGAFSATGGTADPRNNAESVFVPAGVTGTFIATIKATNIAGDGVPNFGGPLDQDYAIVVYNAIETPVAVITGDSATLTAESCSPANSAIDPNETVTISFALKNVGTGNTTNLVGTLQSSGGVTSPSGPQTYGALIAGGAAVAKPFTFTANGTCGGTITATLHLQDGANDLGNVTFTFTLGFLNPLSVTANYTTGGLSTPIPDVSTIQSSLVVSDTGVASDVNVRIRLNHTFDADLDIFLIGPDGTTVELSTDNGGSGDNFGSGANDCTGTFTVFDDSAGTSITAGTAPFNGPFKPEGLLSAFNGKSINGTWKLQITDDLGGDVGTLFCWQLEIARRNFVCCGVPGTPLIVTAGSALTAESCAPPNGAADPNETVTFNFSLNNAGSGASTNLVATLQATGGVSAPSGPQNYGVVPAGGPAVSRPFTFVPTGSCGGVVTVTLQLQDGATNLGTVTFTITLGTSVTATATFANSTSIAIPGTGTSGVAAPYPSNIIVSGMTGLVSKVTLTLTNLSHTFPDDIDVLLVGPAGQKVVVMSDVGGSDDVTNVTLTLDDAAASSLPDSTALATGTFRPTNIGTGDAFAAPAPAPPHGTALSDFNGTTPNGTWSLYAVDDLSGDIGSIAGGWSLTITTAVPVCCSSPCTLTCPANITKPNDPNQCGAVVNYAAPIVGGTCGTVSCSPASGLFFPVGTTTVTCSASAAATTCSFTVTVQDTAPPTISCPPSMLLQAPPGAASLVVTYPAPTTTDNCPLTVVCSPASGSAFLPGTTTVTCTATDPSSNTASCSFTVTVNNVIVRDDAQGVFIRFGAKPGGGVTTYSFFDCRKNISYNGTGLVTITSCKIELKDPFNGDKTGTQNVSVVANPCTLAGSASVKLPGATTTYTLNDPNINNNPLNCP